MNKQSFLPFALPDIGDEEISEVCDSLKSGWLTTGPKVKIFENNFSSWLGTDASSLAVSSATSGLHLALEACGISVGDEVITTTHTFTATASVIRYLGATPIIVDIDPSTMCISVDEVSKAISEKTRAIIPVHFAGNAANMSDILSIARPRRIRVIEDAAHALPTKYKGQLIGNLESDATVFSFYANKTITTGEGGMVVTKDSSVSNRIKTMRLHGISRDAFDRYTSKTPSWHYDVIAPGFKYNMTDISAAIGIHQLDKAFYFQEKRSEIARLYNSKLQKLPLLLPYIPTDENMHSWHLYVIRLKDGLNISRNEVIDNLYKLGIGCGVHYIPLHNHPYWKESLQLTNNMFPVSQSVYEKSISLPIYSKMKQSDALRVIEALEKVFHNW